jgi:hypothetical protein
MARPPARAAWRGVAVLGPAGPGFSGRVAEGGANIGAGLGPLPHVTGLGVEGADTHGARIGPGGEPLVVTPPYGRAP